MTVTIKYKSDFADGTISSVTQQWAAEHGDITTSGAKKYGFFAGGDYFSGTQYAVPSSHDASTGMIVEGELNYSFMPQHTFSGRIDSLALGKKLEVSTTGLGKQFAEPLLEFSGLDITGEFDPLKTKAENHQGEMHKATYGFMRGNADPFLDILKAKGIDVDTPLKDMAIASQFDNNNEMVSDAPMPVIDVIGSYDEAEVLMAA
ncbi:heme acquisition protein HasA [Yersinia hibernica]|uniref:Heme acquisition hemophore HasA n=1 Tax=Yersinia enterocolitica LC20 TaxID=1443113 RepID=A0A7U4GIY6_YEREN|nr:heme acquisition protein HasA [Yersinia hibernica]AHM76379.1 heme acquisition hemophore HasA [Yersinia hibernica]OVZ85559.1 heme acquisition hemophore HasA [Yersinia kristensenii]